MNRFLSILILLTFSVTAPVISGCRTNETSESEPIPASVISASTPVQNLGAVETAPKVEVSKQGNILETHQIRVTKTLLEKAAVGGIIRYQIEVNALKDVGPVRVTETMPKGIEFQSATPKAKRSDQEISWIFPSINQGETLSLLVSAKPISEGDHKISTTVSVENRLSLDLFSGQPELTIEKQGPKTVELGEVATWRVTVSNEGTAEARNIAITDKLPNAFEPTTEMRHTLDTLAAGATKTVEYSAKAVTQGEFKNNAIATYDGGKVDSVETGLPIKVVRSGIRVRKTGPEEA